MDPWCGQWFSNHELHDYLFTWELPLFWNGDGISLHRDRIDERDSLHLHSDGHQPGRGQRTGDLERSDAAHHPDREHRVGSNCCRGRHGDNVLLGSGGGTVSYSTTSGDCSVGSSSGVVTGLHAGTNNCTIAISVAQTATYTSATDTLTFSIGQGWGAVGDVWFCSVGGGRWHRFGVGDG